MWLAFFAELYIDEKKQTYQTIGFKRYNVLTVLGALVTKAFRDGMNKVSSFFLLSYMKKHRNTIQWFGKYSPSNFYIGKISKIDMCINATPLAIT